MSGSVHGGGLMRFAERMFDRDTVQYLRTQGKSRMLYARVRHAGKTVGYSETTLSDDGRPTKAKLTVPSGPAKLTLTFYASVPSAAFPPETWLPPRP